MGMRRPWHKGSSAPIYPATRAGAGALTKLLVEVRFKVVVGSVTTDVTWHTTSVTVGAEPTRLKAVELLGNGLAEQAAASCKNAHQP